MPTIDQTDPLALAVVGAIRSGDVPALERLLDANPGLAGTRVRDASCGESRSLLHVAADWPGHFPRVAATVRTLVAAGADVDARFDGAHSETPLHWAASSDDVEALDALIDAGADIQARGAVIAGGTPLADATAFGQWTAARRLVERGAQATLWEAAALGLADRVDEHFGGEDAPTSEELTSAFWGACHGGQRATAEYLLARGADVNWVGWDELTPLDAAQRSDADELVAWLREVGGLPARELSR